MLKNISDSKYLSLDNICYLIGVTITENKLHQQVETETESMRFCAELPVQSNEFFKAGQADIKASKVLMLDSEDYSGEKIVRYNGMKYAVYRTYPRPDSMTELYLQERSGVR